MGPIGYILGSPYSPLRVEREIPSQHWRDAFEDLLALETTGEMISEEYRKLEHNFTQRKRYDAASDVMQKTSTLRSGSRELDGRMLNLIRLAEQRKDGEETIHFASRARTLLAKGDDDLLTQAASIKAEYEANVDRPASNLKSPGQWIASLISHGALPHWYWSEKTTMDGPLMEFGRINASPDLEASLTATEKELSAAFEDQIPFGVNSPEPLPNDRLQAVANNELTAKDSKYSPIKSSQPKPGSASILKQICCTQSFKRPDGSVGTSVSLVNELVNGMTVRKDNIEEPEKSFEEIYNARVSMQQLRSLVMIGPHQNRRDQIVDVLNAQIDQRFADLEDESILE
ncbi:MAG: hypothetical protein Q9174_002050 [Haloplaca sp. 1 TL-2023]